MIISHQYRFILICNPKTASRTMRQCMAQLKVPFTNITDNRLKPAFVFKTTCADVWNNYTTIGFCRNPFDRLVSIFSDLQNLRRQIRKYDFRQWVKQIPALLTDQECSYAPLLSSQHWYLGENGGHEKLAVKLLGRFENLNEDWNKIFVPLGLPSVTLPMNHKSDHVPYRELYDEETADIVRTHYSADFALFKYAKEL